MRVSLQPCVACLPFRLHSRFHPCATESLFDTSPSSSSFAFSWQTATGEDDLSLYFLGRSSSSNKGISFFVLFSFTLPPFRLFLSLFPLPLVAVPIHLAASCFLCFFPSPYSSSTIVHLRPLATTLAVHVVFDEKTEIL